MGVDLIVIVSGVQDVHATHNHVAQELGTRLLGLLRRAISDVVNGERDPLIRFFRCDQ